MNILSQFMQAFQPKQATAPFAKERLKILISHERLNRDGPDYLPLLRKELLDVITKYIPAVKGEDVKVDIERTDRTATLALNITLNQIPKDAAIKN